MDGTDVTQAVPIEHIFSRYSDAGVRINLNVNLTLTKLYASKFEPF